jgi:hypothetical protein
MAKQINPTSWADRYVSGMQGAGAKYKNSIDQVSENPMQQAAAKLDKAKRNYIEAIDSGRTAAALNSVSLETWKMQAKNKGAARLGTGAQEAKSKVIAYAQRAAPAMQALQAQIRSMPSDTPADMDRRQLAWSAGMRAMAGRG